MTKTTKANLALFLAAFFWGTTFIFQREAMNYLSPLAYSGIRFAVGGLALLPLAIPRAFNLIKQESNPAQLVRFWLMGSFLSGTMIFVGVNFQQYGLVWTTAGKAGFITSLYVVFVPLILRFSGQKITIGEGLGAALAVVGLYLLSFTGFMAVGGGDVLVLAGALIWAFHVLTLGWLAPRMDALVLGAGQALVCGLMGLFATALLGQWPSWAALSEARLHILWGSILSVTLGFTLQVVGQKAAKPAPAAIIMQMEAVIAAFTGWLILNEIMTARMLTGAAVMLIGMLISQLWPILTRRHYSIT
ncbi:MAG: DMT family transporter [Candidatus Adiutrix sp.]